MTIFPAAEGATGATSNPVIVSDLIRTGRFDEQLLKLLDQGKTDEEAAWILTEARRIFGEEGADPAEVG